jgi:RsiW-degrading membrane proteinase PrsW (M82 family)
MTGMEHDGYWYRYLAARHDIEFYLSVVFITVALASAVSGYTLVKYQGIVRRTDDPKSFWQTVAVYLLIGTACWGLYAYGPR